MDTTRRYNPTRTIPAAMCAAALAAELASWLTGWVITVGWVPLFTLMLWSPAAVAVNLADNKRRHVWGTVTVTALALAALIVVSTQWVQIKVVAALLMSASSEEVVYRAALPAAIVAALSRAKVPRTPAFAAAAAVSSLLFAFLPGHVDQMGAGPFAWAPWAAMSTLWFWMLWRGLPLIVPVLSHTAFNLAATVVAEGGPEHMWQTSLVGVVAAIVVAETAHDCAERTRHNHKKLPATPPDTHTATNTT